MHSGVLELALRSPLTYGPACPHKFWYISLVFQLQVHSFFMFAITIACFLNINGVLVVIRHGLGLDMRNRFQSQQFVGSDHSMSAPLQGIIANMLLRCGAFPLVPGDARCASQVWFG
jgi:hypothetical protein